LRCGAFRGIIPRKAGVHFKCERAPAKVKKEAVWGIKEAVDLVLVREKCIRQPAQIVRKNAKCLSSPEMSVRYIARIVSQSARIAAVK